MEGSHAAWLGYIDPAHEAGKLIQRITKGTLRATEAWTDSRHAEDDKLVELDYELAVALANVTEGAARATVLKVTQAEPDELASLEAPGTTTKESGAGPRRAEPPGGERGLRHSQHSTTSPKTMMMSTRQED